MARLRILLPALRDRCGSGVLASHGKVLCGPFRVLGTANPRIARNPPTGGYIVTALLPPGVPQERFPRLGRAGAIVLHGPAGRVLLHGGRLDDRGRLRRTRGGLRVADADLAALFDAIERTRAAGDPLSVVEVIDVAPIVPTRRRFLAQTLAVVAGVVVLDACATEAGPCEYTCTPGAGGPGGVGCGSGSGSGSASGSGSGSGR